MKYMGSKARHAKEILKVIAPYRKEDQSWVEPFVGGANMIDKVEAPLRIGGDFNEYVIAVYHALQSGEKLPEGIDQQYYEIVKSNKEQFPKWVVGLIGFCFTFGAKWFGGIRRGRRVSRPCRGELPKRGKDPKSSRGLRHDTCVLR